MQASSKIGVRHVIWQAALRPIPPDPRIAASRRRAQAREVVRERLAAIQGESRNVAQVRENDHLSDLGPAQKSAPAVGHSNEGAELAFSASEEVPMCAPIPRMMISTADPSYAAEAEAIAAVLFDDVVDEPIPLDLWREYVAAANDGAFEPRDVDVDSDGPDDRDEAFKAWRRS